MRVFVYIFLAVTAVCAAGIATCRAARLDAHLHELSIAAGAVFVASMAGAIPFLLSRGGPQVSIVQAALIGTLIQMLGSISLGLAAAVLKLAAPMPLFLWLLMFYWACLAAFVAALIRAIHQARDASIAPSK